jgi:hypothetical protein
MKQFTTMVYLSTVATRLFRIRGVNHYLLWYCREIFTQLSAQCVTLTKTNYIAVLSITSEALIFHWSKLHLAALQRIVISKRRVWIPPSAPTEGVTFCLQN